MRSGGFGSFCKTLRLCIAKLSNIVRSCPCIAWFMIVQVAASLIILRRMQSVIVTKQMTVVTGDHQLVTERPIYSGQGFNFSQETENGLCLKDFLENYSRYCRTSIVAPVERGRGNSIEGRVKDICPCLPQNLRRVDLHSAMMETSTNRDGHWEKERPGPGGRSSPSWCTARQRVAVIVPYRNRPFHLEIFLRVIHPFLQRQLLNYTIFIVEQVEPKVFNKASLMNAGFNETSSRHPDLFDCFIFHDVDILPEDDRNFYGCYKTPRHLAAFVDKYKYRMKYNKMFGGVTAFTRNQFLSCNGFSNEFYGWGGEDDDMWNRLKAANMTILRFPNCVSRYTMLQHAPDELNPRNRRAAIGWSYRPDVYRRNGLNSVSYDLIGYEERPLYTWITVSLDQPPSLPTKPIAKDSERDRETRRRQREEMGGNRKTDRRTDRRTDRNTERDRDVDNRDKQRYAKRETERKRERREEIGRQR